MCKILCQNINKCGYYKYVPPSRDNFTEFLLIYPPKMASFSPIQLGIIANIVS